MQVKRFRVTNFRSVKDSGWIEIDRVTSLIGVNESGKTNLLLPLWKFRPAREGEIIPTADYPKKMFGEIRENPASYKFIEVELDCSEEAAKFADLTGYPADQLKRVVVSRYYDAKYRWSFPDVVRPTTIPATDVTTLMNDAIEDIKKATALKGEVDLQSELTGRIQSEVSSIGGTAVDREKVTELATTIQAALPEEPMKTSTIAPRAAQLIDKLRSLEAELSKPLPNAIEGVWTAVRDSLPKFVYYSNYGNLDSEIYLPHVVENLGRDDLGAKEAAKARTLRVLFTFVRLEPNEILELGREFEDPSDPDREPTAEEIEEIATKKKERSILLQSAGARLTEKFREWWNQGDYRFRFDADGNHFRIWVSDDLRPEEIELENRSTGLQWFLSFYLVFLVESTDAHENAFLLLDEPGLSLHPLAQRDLSFFFDNLAESNQLIYTTHSPFLIDADRLDRARKVFVAGDGTTECSPDLRAASGRQEGASYAVYSALNLSVAESLLLGCRPIVVEGPSDQHYLTAIKTLLIGAGKISPTRELVFPPSGGVRTAKSIASMLGGKEDDLPKLFLDGDKAGAEFAKNAKQTLYAGTDEKIKTVSNFMSIADAEIEDLFPADFLIPIVDRLWRQAHTLFEATYVKGDAIVPQIEKWAETEGFELGEGWKVVLAREVKKIALLRGIEGFSDDVVKKWIEVFDWFNS